MAADRFWSKVATGGAADCWTWLATRNQHGYGLFWGRREKRWLRAHRVAWELTRGAIPEGLFVCHRCDNPPCCNPAHLFLGTQKANMADCAAKGRVVSKVPTGDDHWTRRRFGGMTPEERFWSFVDRSDPGDCWLWPEGDPHAGGYGRYWDPEREALVLAHRFAWTITNGEPAKGQSIAHVCDNRLCVNPAHLFGGTLAEFFRAHPERKPAYARRVGTENPAAKLSPELVREIRARHAAGETILALAGSYGVTSVSIGNILRRKTWAHVR